MLKSRDLAFVDQVSITPNSAVRITGDLAIRNIGSGDDALLGKDEPNSDINRSEILFILKELFMRWKDGFVDFY